MQQRTLPNSLGLAVARILGPGGRPVGTAFLAARDRLLTAAHVVNLAIGRELGEQACPTAEVELDFPLVNPGRRLRTMVEHWVPMGGDQPGDIAGLRLTDAVELPMVPAPIVEPDAAFDLKATALGFPSLADDGVWSILRLRGRQGTGWVQFDLDSVSQFPVKQGFSGAPVWDPQRGTVVGMITDAWDGGGVQSGYMVPAERLFAAWPKLRELAQPPSPFPGLRAFDEIDAPLFFGRDDLIDQIITMSATSPIITVNGGTGVGKSSLLAAGVIPKLRQRTDALVVKCVPNEARTPSRTLALSLADAAELEATATRRLETAETFDTKIRQGCIAEVVTSVLRTRHQRRLVLVVDQLEQVLTSGVDQIDAFGRALDAFTATEGRQCLVLGIRDDFLPSVGRSRHLASLTARAHQIPVADLNAAELQDAIEGPLRRLSSVRFESQLIDRLIADVEHQPGRMPLVQFALAELWDRQRDGVVRYETYRDLGDIRLMLSQYADGVWQGLSPTERDLARRLLSQLVHPVPSNERAFTRRVVARTDVSAELWKIAGRLAGDRLVVVGEVERGPGRTEVAVELAHEALIVHWQTLTRTVREDRDFRLWQDGLRHRADRWSYRPQTVDGGYFRQLLRPRHPLRFGGHGRQARLLSIGELREARRWRRRHLDLSSVELRYLATSRTRHAVAWTRVTALIVIASLVPLYLVMDSNREREALRSQRLSERLAAQSLEAATVDGVLARLLAAAAWKVSETDEAWNAMTNAVNQPVIDMLDEVHQAEVKALEFSPDRTMMATGAGDGTLALWDTATWEPTEIPEHLVTTGLEALTLTFSPDGSTVAAASSEGQVLVWGVAEQRAVKNFWPFGENRGTPADAVSLAYSRDGLMLAVGFGDWSNIESGDAPGIRVLDAVSFELITEIPVDAPVTTLMFNSTGANIFAGDFNGTVHGWDLASGEEFGSDDHLSGEVRSIESSPVDPSQVTACGGGSCELWETKEAAITRLGGGSYGTFSAAGDLIAVKSPGAVTVWSVADKVPVGTVPYSGRLGQIGFGPDGTTIAAGTEDGVVLWDLRQFADVRVLQGDGLLEDMTFTTDGSAIAAVSNTIAQSSAGLWEIDERSIASEYSVDGWSFRAVSPDGSRAASLMLGTETRVQVTDLGNGTGIAFDAYETQITDYRNYTVTMAFSNDGTVLATGWWFRDTSEPVADDEAELRLWDADTGELLLAVEGFEESSVTYIDFSPDGSMVATDKGGRVMVWDTQDGSLVAELRPNNHIILGLDFTPDGSLAIGTGKGLTIWDIAEGTSSDYTLGQGASVSNVSASPDGRYLAFIANASALGSSPDGAVIWDMTAAAVAATISGDEGVLSSVEFSPDGSSLALSSGWPIRIVDVSFLRDPYSAVCGQAGRELTNEEWSRYLGDVSRGSLDVCGGEDVRGRSAYRGR